MQINCDTGPSYKSFSIVSISLSSLTLYNCWAIYLDIPRVLDNLFALNLFHHDDGFCKKIGLDLICKALSICNNNYRECEPDRLRDLRCCGLLEYLRCGVRECLRGEFDLDRE